MQKRLLNKCLDSFVKCQFMNEITTKNPFHISFLNHHSYPPLSPTIGYTLQGDAREQKDSESQIENRNRVFLYVHFLIYQPPRLPYLHLDNQICLVSLVVTQWDVV